MTIPSTEPPNARRFRLLTLGTARLVGPDDDTVLGDHGQQRRRIALLAVLAASREKGRSRDQLLGLFWPEATQSKARHSLDQLLYALRTSLGGTVFEGANPLRLNAALITSDVEDFSAAIAREDFGAAVALYGGPFLDGFYLNDSPEFEQWVDAERARTERSYLEALEALAKRAEDAGDFGEAARWRQRLVDTDPVSGKHAMGLIRALMNGGDHAAALQFAERHEAVVAQELGTNVGPAVAALVAEVRARAKSGSVVVRGAPPAPTVVSPQVPENIAADAERAPVERNEALAPTKTTDAPVPAAASPAPTPALFAARDAGPPVPTARESHPPRSARNRRTALLAGVAVLGLLAVLAGAAWLRNRDASGRTAAASSQLSIAVLPLKNLSGRSEDAPIADGLTEEFIGVLARIEGLRVIARTSAFAFRNSDLGVRGIADSLQVSHVLEGGVQKDGQRLRVQVRLVDARDGSTEWSETYDRDLKDLFVVQSEIAATVARRLDLRLGQQGLAAVRKGHTSDIAAYELYLRGSDPTLIRSDSGNLLALGYFKQAIARDSTYAAAYAGLARVYLTLHAGGRRGPPTREGYDLAKAAALKAVALNDSLSEAHLVLGMVLMREYDFAAAEKALMTAVRLDPGYSRTHEFVARLYQWTREPEDFLAAAKRAVESDPLSTTAQAEVAIALCSNGKFADALDRLKRIADVKPPLQRAKFYEGICYGMQGQWSAALATFQEFRGGPGMPFYIYFLARGGRRAEAIEILSRLKKDWHARPNGASVIAVGSAGLGDYDEAFRWLDRSVDDLSLSHWIMLPLLSELHADPRFEQFRARLGIQKR